MLIISTIGAFIVLALLYIYDFGWPSSGRAQSAAEATLHSALPLQLAIGALTLRLCLDGCISASTRSQYSAEDLGCSMLIPLC